MHFIITRLFFFINLCFVISFVLLFPFFTSSSNIIKQILVFFTVLSFILFPQLISFNILTLILLIKIIKLFIKYCEREGGRAVSDNTV